jgi:hypothetical protein
MYQIEVRKIMAAGYWVVEEFWMHMKMLLEKFAKKNKHGALTKS